jgi:hypothetical protein
MHLLTFFHNLIKYKYNVHLIESKLYILVEVKTCNETKKGACEHLGSPSVFSRVRVAHIFIFLCCVFCFVCHPPVSGVPNVAFLWIDHY